ncbi:DNA methyltransferase [Streptomyces sp. CNQ-509]|uniref:type ISP restriction/modification enzyme n=1 Tax=Streptomyces sp. CNQ-509 TaxID=444103 RepID=UPI00062DF887|nr:type ISP restriction/modification enzyme [Streptomyces sp. CNQ-509]AKH81594.1 DNA methyltransferase [Streptomyces sp. CNQ-509]
MGGSADGGPAVAEPAASAEEPPAEERAVHGESAADAAPAARGSVVRPRASVEGGASPAPSREPAEGDSAPLLADLMPWGVAPLRLGRGWVMAPDAASLRRRWDALVRAEGDERDALFRATRARTTHSAVAQLPGRAAGTGRLAREAGPCPEPVRVLHGAYDRQWLIPDNRLLDAARPELWRVADDRQLFAVEAGYVTPGPGGSRGLAVVASALLPDGRSPAGRPGRIRPLYRRPRGRGPNLPPRLLRWLGRRLGGKVGAEDVFAWVLAAGQATPRGCAVPLTADPEVWRAGVERGRRLLEVQLRGARGGGRPRLPGGRRPYVRAALPARPAEVSYDPEEEALLLGEGRISPVPRGAWEFTAGGVPVLEQWLAARLEPAEPGTLAAIRPAAWPQEWTSELLELITVLALLAEAADPGADEARGTDGSYTGEITAEITAAELHEAGILPAPASARRPASVLDHHEEGPEGQFALI